MPDRRLSWFWQNTLLTLLRLKHTGFSALPALLLLVFALPTATAQTVDATGADLELLRAVVPLAESFSEKEGEAPAFKAFGVSPESGEQTVIGYAFLTRDYPPEEIGYSAPIDMLVGMDLEGTLTGFEVLNYRESYKSIRGDFLATEGFPQQFKGKTVADGFRVGRDVDGVSRATITSWAVSRGVRNTARQVALAYLEGSSVALDQQTLEAIKEYYNPYSWADMIEMGHVVKMVVPEADGTQLELSITYIGHEALGEVIVGTEDYSRGEREASNRVRSGHMVLVGIGGNSSRQFRQERLAITQGETFSPLPRRRFVYVGSADYGKITDQVRFAGAMVLDEAIDITQPFTVQYDTGEEMGEYDSVASIDFALSPPAMALVQGLPFPPIEDDYMAGADDGGLYSQLTTDAPWGQVAAILLLFVLVMTAFLRKSSAIRWVALAYTLLYLGFYDGGFLSISHVTNGLKLGTSLFLSDLPLLLLVIFTLVTTLLWGRIFCSSLCPFGALQDFLTRIVPRRFQVNVPQAIHDKAIYIKYGILALILVAAFTVSDISIFQYFEPFGTIFFFSRSTLLWGILIAFLLASSVIKRFYCRYACPLGASLGVVSMISPFKIKRVPQCDVCKVCEHACPTGAIRGPEIDFKECVRCDLCEIKLIARSGVCKHDMADVKSRLKNWEPVNVT